MELFKSGKLPKSFQTILLLCFFGINHIFCQTDTLYDKYFALSLDELLNLEVTTTSKYSTKLSHSAANTTVITADMIQAYGWRNLADILKAQAGFDVFTDHIYNFIVTRGFYQSNDPNSRILLMIDGHSVVEFFGYYNGQLSNIDVNFIDRIEIVKGPSSAIYGTNAMFSVINIIPKKGYDLRGLNIITETGNFNHHKAAIAHGNKFKEDFNYSMSAFYLNTNEQPLYFPAYNNPAYPTAGYTSGKCNKEENYNANIYLNYKDFTLNTYYNNRKKYVPTGIYGGKLDDSRTFFSDMNAFTGLTYNKTLNSKYNVQLKAYADVYEFNGRYIYDIDTSLQLGPPYESEFNKITNWYYITESNFQARWNPKHTSIAGFEYKNYYKHRFEYYSENDTNQTLNIFNDKKPDIDIISAFLIHKYSILQQLNLEAGVHYDNYKHVGEHWSFRGTISYIPFKWLETKLIYGEAFRAPNLWELKGGFYIVGNANIKPEIIRNAECMLTARINNNILLSNSIFAYRIEKNIRLLKDSVFDNTDKTEGFGIESNFQYVTPLTSAYINALWAQANNKNTKKQIPFAAQYLAKWGAYRNFFKTNLIIAFEQQLIGPRNTFIYTALPTYCITNINVTTYAFNRKIQISTGIYNLFNTQYENPAFKSDLASWNKNSQYKMYSIPALGRQLVLKIKYTPRCS